MHIYRTLFCGYILVEIDNKNLSRFLNIAAARGIVFLRLNCGVDNTSTFSIRDSDIDEFKYSASKSHLDYKIIKKYGLKTRLAVFKHRYGFISGLLAFAAVTIILTMFVWDISLVGGDRYNESDIINLLKNYNIKQGVLKSSIDCDELETNIRNNFNDVSWVCVEIRGTRLVVHIKESIIPPKSSSNKPHDIIAAKSGVITELIVRSGIPMVKIGDSVKKGQILVSGAVPITNDSDEIISYDQVAADCDLKAKVRYKYKETQKLKYSGINLLNLIREDFIQINKNKVIVQTTKRPLSNYVKESLVEQVTVLRNLALPVYIGTDYYYVYEKAKKKYTSEQANDVLMVKLGRFLTDLSKKGIQILEKNVTIDTNNVEKIMKANITTIEDISAVSEINQDSLKLTPELSTE